MLLGPTDLEGWRILERKERKKENYFNKGNNRGGKEHLEMEEDIGDKRIGFQTLVDDKPGRWGQRPRRDDYDSYNNNL